MFLPSEFQGQRSLVGYSPWDLHINKLLEGTNGIFLISGSSAFSKTSLNIRKFTVHILLKPGLENFEFLNFGF